MKVIFKFAITMASDFTLIMPHGYKVLHVAEQAPNSPFFWAEVDSPPNLDMDLIHFTVVGTGHTVPVEGTHIGTWLSGDFVWHLYQR